MSYCHQMYFSSSFISLLPSKMSSKRAFSIVSLFSWNRWVPWRIKEDEVHLFSGKQSKLSWGKSESCFCLWHKSGTFAHRGQINYGNWRKRFGLFNQWLPVTTLMETFGGKNVFFWVQWQLVWLARYSKFVTFLLFYQYPRAPSYSMKTSSLLQSKDFPPSLLAP